ncbi:MAG: bL28 family ribosomal protein [Candidatus Buchananbacteria bacterium]
MPTCTICNRLPLKGNSISHSNIKTIKRQKLNLQTKTIDGKKTKICTKCLKTMAKAAQKKTK